MKFKDQLIAIEDETGEEVCVMGMRTVPRPAAASRVRERLWRQVGSVFVAASLLYVCYVLFLVQEEDMGDYQAKLRRQQNIEYMKARNHYVEVLVNSSGVVGCPVQQPALRLLEHFTHTASYIPCSTVFYNRVPKCASRSVLHVIKELSERYNYSFVRESKPDTGLNYYRSFSNLKSFVSNFSSMSTPVVYSRHLHYINFTRFGVPPPVYINVVREPVDRLISHYYYKSFGSNNAPSNVSRTNMSLDECVSQNHRLCLGINEMLPFFCGNARHCRNRNNNVLQIAKRTVREGYLFVGITEDLPAFMETLETLLPQFFFNASQVFRENEENMHLLFKTYRKPTVSRETIAKLKDHLSFEYDLYRFIQQRFYTLYNKINALKRNLEKEKKQRDKRKFLNWFENIS